MDTIRSRLIETRIADGVAQNKLKKFRISTYFGGCERKVLLSICLCIANILGDTARLRKPGNPAYLDKVLLRELGGMARLLPISEGGKDSSDFEPPATGWKQ
jgi:hypothetical protein